jgi:hypothetical protein
LESSTIKKKICIALAEPRFGENFEVSFGEKLHEKHAVKRGFWVPNQHLL